MSLDVHLKVKEQVQKKSSGIFVRENGQTIEITQQEWNERNPDKEPFKIIEQDGMTHHVFDYNITHNLGKMATEAGLYQYLWRPDELNISIAKDLIEPLKDGLGKLLDNPDYYKTFNPENGWGNFEGLLKFVSSYLKACIDYPNAEISVSR